MQRFRIAAIFGGDPGRSLDDRLDAVTEALAEELGRGVGIWRPDADGHLTLVAASAGLITTDLEPQGAAGQGADAQARPGAGRPVGPEHGPNPADTDTDTDTDDRRGRGAAADVAGRPGALPRYGRPAGTWACSAWPSTHPPTTP